MLLAVRMAFVSVNLEKTTPVPPRFPLTIAASRAISIRASATNLSRLLPPAVIGGEVPEDRPFLRISQVMALWCQPMLILVPGLEMAPILTWEPAGSNQTAAQCTVSQLSLAQGTSM